LEILKEIFEKYIAKDTPIFKLFGRKANYGTWSCHCPSQKLKTEELDIV